MNNTTATKQDVNEFRDEISRQFASLIELVAAGFETLNGRFDRLEPRIDQLEEFASDAKKRFRKIELGVDRVDKRFGEITLPLHILEREQAETNKWLGGIDGSLEAAQSDIKEIYLLIDKNQAEFATQLKSDPEQEDRLKKLEDFALSAARQIGLDPSIS